MGRLRLWREIGQDTCQRLRAVFNTSKEAVAWRTEKPAYSACGVAMVNEKALAVAVLADSTDAALLLQHGVVGVYS